MNIYLEYKDEKSAKFWKIDVNNNTHTVTYGKIGTNGQSKTKTFESVEKATKEAEKLIKAKTKKGYQEIKTETNTPSLLKTSFLEKEEAMQRFNLKQYNPLGSISYDAILLIEGDLTLESGLHDSSINAAFFNGKRETERELIIIDGNLTIKGGLSISGETGYPSLLILGDIHCEELDSYDNIIHIAGDAYIDYTFYGNYNHGAIKIAGTTHVPYVINSDHHSDINPCESAILINVYNDEDVSFAYDYYSSDLGRVFLENLVEIDDEEEDEVDYEYSLELGAFINWIKAGKSPFKDSAKPSRELIEDEIKQLLKKNRSGADLKELDLREKKLLKLPAALFELESLEVLDLSENDFTILPDDIGKLVNLRELNLGTTNIKQLPSSIGKLKNLEVLNLRYCRNLTSLPEAIGELSNLKQLNLHAFRGEVSSNISKLNNLEELNITRVNIQGHISRCERITFPDWVCELKGLKKLEANENAFINLPDALANLSNLECLNLTSSIACLEKITDLSKLKNLKELKVSGHSEIKGIDISQEILQHFFKIKSLELLSISRFDKIGKRRGMIKGDFKGLDQLVNLKELKIIADRLNHLPEEIKKLKHLKKIYINTKRFSQEDKNALEALNLECL
jgi:predicted DNA-binding WGR domain protein/Leucine-rich repeat (LRR) protein